MLRFIFSMTRPRFYLLFVVAIAALIAIFNFPASDPRDSAQSAGITLGLTAEARESLQQTGQAFPASQAGFSAYFRVQDETGGFGLDKIAVDQALFSDSGPTIFRAGIGTLIESGGNYGIGGIPIFNIDGLVTQVNLYYDEEGWIVAYLSSGQESSRVWQAVELSTENPALVDISRTTLLDAINEVVTQALNHPAVSHDQLGYYHWEHPSATRFLMFATARGTIGSDVMSFAVPSNFLVQEVSTAMWISTFDLPCARTILDGVDITGEQCNSSFHYSQQNLGEFNSLSAHTLILDHLNQDNGASGALVMLVYSAP